MKKTDYFYENKNYHKLAPDEVLKIKVNQLSLKKSNLIKETRLGDLFPP